MGDDSENYDLEEATEAARESAEYFDRITSYSRQEAMMEDREGLVMDAVGTIGAFATSMEGVDEQTDYVIEGEEDRGDVVDKVMSAGVAWPDAMKAYNAIDNVSDELSDQMVAAAFYGDEELDSAGETVEDLQDAQRQYREAMATAVASSKTLAPEGYDTPVDIALEVAEDEEVVRELEGLEEEVPRTQEEAHQQLMNTVEGLA
ncbi:MAG: hypothetical protein ABEJ87_00805 [Candidatus Nanohalobium sp.]